MNNNFEEVNKDLGVSVTTIRRLKCKGWARKVNTFNVKRAKFCQALREDGYETFTVGNYITATRGDETNTFFFACHNSWNSHYLIPKTLANRVQYFAFYDNSKNQIYIVGYGKVREYTSKLTTGYKFYNGDTKLYIDDSWAHAQQINTYVVA